MSGRADVTPELLGQLAGAFGEMWERGENERALKLAEGLGATFPGAPEIAALLGDCHARCGDLARAVEAYVEAATRLPAAPPHRGPRGPADRRGPQGVRRIARGSRSVSVSAVHPSRSRMLLAVGS